jgi:NADH-quinone oxidoreductase subunit C
MLTNEAVAKEIISQFGEAVSDFDDPYDLLTLTVQRDQLIPLLRWLKTHAPFQINFLTDLTGVHYPDSPGREFAVIYHLHSLTHNFRVRVKVFAAENDLVVPTATVLYNSANWMERETYDFYGIHFQGHPDLRRILNMDEMDYFPMRKQYPLEDDTRRDKIDELFGR